MAHVRQSRPDSSLGFHRKVLNAFNVIPASLGRGCCCRNVKRFRGGLVFKAHKLVYHSTLGLRVIKKKKAGAVARAGRCVVFRVSCIQTPMARGQSTKSSR